MMVSQYQQDTKCLSLPQHAQQVVTRLAKDKSLSNRQQANASL
jgi:hypothetical protein